MIDSQVVASRTCRIFPLASHDDDAGVAKLRHSADANGKTTNVEVISEPQGYQMGDYLKKALPLLDSSPEADRHDSYPYLVGPVGALGGDALN